MHWGMAAKPARFVCAECDVLCFLFQVYRGTVKAIGTLLLLTLILGVLLYKRVDIAEYIRR